MSADDRNPICVICYVRCPRDQNGKCTHCGAGQHAPGKRLAGTDSAGRKDVTGSGHTAVLKRRTN